MVYTAGQQKIEVGDIKNTFPVQVVGQPKLIRLLLLFMKKSTKLILKH
jgi:hypothetical protein